MGLTIHYTMKTAYQDAKTVRGLVEKLHERARELPFARVSDVQELTGDTCTLEGCGGQSVRKHLVLRSNWVLGEDGLPYQIPPHHVIGFVTEPGEGCEIAPFGFCRHNLMEHVPRPLVREAGATPSTSNPTSGGSTSGGSTSGGGGWGWIGFCKTQYASNPACGGVENFLRCHLAVTALLDYAQELGVEVSVHDEGGYWERRDPKTLVEEVDRWNRQIAAIYGRLRDSLPGPLRAPISEYPDFEHLEAEGHSSDSEQPET